MSNSIDANLVAARTRTATQILETPALLAIYETSGGLADDLIAIRDAGLKAEAELLAQSQVKGEGVAATMDVLQSFASLQKDYVAIMAVLPAVRRDLEKAGVKGDVLVAIDRIMVNEAPVVIATEIQEDGTTKRKASRSVKQEALRAEIGKDAKALLELTAAHGALIKRKVTVERLTKLADGAEQLAGKLATRTTKKGAGKEKTAAKNEAMQAQHEAWISCHRLLKLTAQQDARVAALLDDVTKASRKKKKKESKES